MNKKLWFGIMVLGGAVFAAGCSTNYQGAAANANANLQATTTTTRPGPDNSEIITTTDANGVTTETRVFRDNRRVSRIVVTTRNGQRTVKAVSRSGEEKEINDVEDVFEATGDKIADAAGFVGDKTEDVAKETGDKAEDIAKETGDKAEDVAGVTKKVGEKTVKGAKTVGKAAAKGAKKTGEAIKKVVTP